MSSPMQMDQGMVQQTTKLQNELSQEIDTRMNRLKAEVEQTLVASGSGMTNALDGAVEQLRGECLKAVTDVTRETAQRLTAASQSFSQLDGTGAKAVTNAMGSMGGSAAGFLNGGTSY